MTGREGINTLAQEFPDLLCRETHDEIIWPDSHTLLYDTSYDWISTVASRAQKEVAYLATTSMRSETAVCRIDIGRRSPAVPVTPPYVRVRIRRFGGLS